MGKMIDAAHRKIFRTEVARFAPRMTALETVVQPINQRLAVERLEVKLIVMSRHTERELMREDFMNETGICSPRHHGEPSQIFGVRIAYDDSLAEGKFLVCGEVY